MNGQFVISLDFEKFWGVFDSQDCNNYERNLKTVDTVIDQLLTLCERYDVKLTFATVGFLFNKTKADFEAHIPSELPSYENPNHSPYAHIKTIAHSESKDSIHYAYKALCKIIDNGTHEVGTHTYCHYYCLESGQTAAQFEADLKMAKLVGDIHNTPIQSIVFPRNQVNEAYLAICKAYGILSYRGVENHPIYQPQPYKDSKKTSHRILRLSDAYFNITGIHTHAFEDLNQDGIINLPSSYFLRPYSKKLSFLEPLKVRRVKQGMRKAAKTNALYHLWFHPHNFGTNMTENFQNFENILQYYTQLKSMYNFESNTMTALSKRLLQQ